MFFLQFLNHNSRLDADPSIGSNSSSSTHDDQALPVVTFIAEMRPMNIKTYFLKVVLNYPNGDFLL
jgi:hypothetical protein